MSDRALFTVAPLVAVSVFLLAAAARLMDARRLGAQPPARFSIAQIGFGNVLPAIGFLGLLIGHVVMITWPDQLLRWNRDLSRLLSLELTLFALGMAGLLGIARAVRRRVLQRVGNGGITEAAFLGVVLLTLVSGLGVALVYRWAAAWSVLTVTPYVRSLMTLRPSIEYIAAMPYLVKLHVFSSFVMLALVAHTRLFDVTLLPLCRATRAIAAPFASGVDRRWRGWCERAIRHGRRLMWPEDED